MHYLHSFTFSHVIIGPEEQLNVLNSVRGMQPEEKIEHTQSQVRHCLAVFLDVARMHNKHTTWQKVQILCMHLKFDSSGKSIRQHFLQCRSLSWLLVPAAFPSKHKQVKRECN